MLACTISEDILTDNKHLKCSKKYIYFITNNYRTLSLKGKAKLKAINLKCKPLLNHAICSKPDRNGT